MLSLTFEFPGGDVHGTAADVRAEVNGRPVQIDGVAASLLLQNIEVHANRYGPLVCAPWYEFTPDDEMSTDG